MTDLKPKTNTILYADDDIDDLQLVEEAFSTYSPSVQLITTKDGVEALTHLFDLKDQDLVPCLVILDINMPRMSGKEVLIKLRQTPDFADVPVILFTTSSMPLDVDFSQKYRAGFLTKPVDIRQMDEITAKFIGTCSEEVRNSIRRTVD